MKIKFLSGPRTGQIDHAPNTQEMQLLVKAGLIEIIPYRDFREMLSAEHNPSAKPPLVEWGIIEATSENSAGHAIIRKSGCETQYLSAAPPDCPSHIRERFEALVNTDPNANAIALDKAKRDQAEYNEMIKTAKRY